MRDKLQRPPYIVNFDRLREDKYFMLLMTAMLLICLYAFYQTIFFRREIARTFPRLILGAIILVILFIFVLKITFVYEYLPDRDLEYPSYDLKRLGIVIAWSFAYLLGVQYIGFFTSSFAFTFLFIMAHDSDELPRRALSALAASGLIVGLAYILLIEILSAVSIFRLGFLP